MHFELFVLLTALLVAVLARVIARLFTIGKLAPRAPVGDLIFVGVASYCDRDWLGAVKHIYESAKHSDRVRVGVVEYVRGPQDSMAQLMDAGMRRVVRVHTVAASVARSVREARHRCIQTLLGTEQYVLFVRGCALRPAWDTTLIDCMRAGDKQALTAPLLHNSEVSAGYSRVARFEDNTLTCIHRPLEVHMPFPVPAIVFSSDLCFCTASVARLVTSRESDLGVSATLRANGIRLMHPGVPIGARRAHPRGLKQITSTVITPEVREYCNAIGIDTDTGVVGARAALGLLGDYGAHEAISKYGSTAAARVRQQERAAKLKQARRLHT